MGAGRVAVNVDVSMDRSGATDRRGFLRRIGGAGLGLGLGSGGGGVGFAELMAARAEDLRRRNMACIVLWMQGGPSQFETFDPKPDHPNGGSWGTIETAAPGIRIAEGWNRTAAAMKDIALIRSLTGNEGNHQRATYQMHTGYAPSGSVRHPSFGSNVASELGDPDFDLPAIVAIGGKEPGLTSGFLDVAYEPFAIGDPTRPPENARAPVPAERFRRRLGLMERLEAAGYARSGGAERVRVHGEVYRQTADMVLSKNMRAFDLEEEPAALRDAYGRTAFGQGCLLARRLVETGVTFVEVRLGNWDTHFDMGDRTRELVGTADPGFGTLVTDLRDRGLLDRTLVVWMGEFGRTPRINGRGGRDHFPRCFSAALAGAGIRGGRALGASSADGSEPRERPLSVNDLLTTFCHALKIDPAKENVSPQGRPLKIVDGGTPALELFG